MNVAFLHSAVIFLQSEKLDEILRDTFLGKMEFDFEVTYLDK